MGSVEGQPPQQQNTGYIHAVTIGIMDSGVGGLTVARAIMDQLPGESVHYIGDTANGPYGPLPIAQARKHALEHFAGRWAAKEAVLKSLGTGWAKGMCWTEMEVRNDPDGKPLVHLCGAVKEQAQALRISDILLTISHCRAYATATAIAVRNGAPGETKPE